MNKPLILVVEDDAPVRNLITTTLKAHDYRFQTAANVCWPRSIRWGSRRMCSWTRACGAM